MIYTHVAAALAALAVGFAGGWKVQGWRWDAERAEQLAEAQRLNTKRASVTAEVDAKHAAASQQIKVVTIKQIEEVPRYVAASDCPMPPGYRVLHDAAVVGAVPDPSSIPHAAPVPAQDAAATAVANLGACRESERRLIDLQQWVRDQLQVR